MLLNLLINAFLIKIPIIVFALLYKFRGIDRFHQNRWMISSTCAAAALLCTQFPVIHTEQFMWDLRLIPLILAVLYGGVEIGTIAYLLTVVGVLIMLPSSYLIELGLTGAGLLLPITLIDRYKSSTLPRKLLLSLSFAAAAYGMIYFLPIPVYLISVTDHTPTIIMMHLLLLTALPIVVFLTEKIAENAAIQAHLQKAERLNIVSELAASIAHEVRNPLTVVKGFLQLLGETNDEKTKLYIQTSISELERADYIISDYLNIAKSEAEVLQPLDTAKLIQTTITVMTPYALMQGIDFRADIQTNDYIFGDATKFKQVMINLIKNAIEATSKGGVISIHAITIQNQVMIKVMDTGIGMTREQQKKLGTLYFSTKEQGTGLGTIVCFRIIKAFKGEIDYCSEPGKGTTVVLSLPVHE